MLAIRAGRVIDGSGADPQADVLVLVEGERIARFYMEFERWLETLRQ